MLLPSLPPSLARTGSLLLLAPTQATVPQHFRQVDVDPNRHGEVLAGLQRLRGSVYLQDGAITASQLDERGRHAQVADDASWHVVALQPDGEPMACARLRVHDAAVAPESLGVWSSALARSNRWSMRLRDAIESDMTLARMRGMSYAELGGWAIAEEWRRTTHVATTALATYALAEAVGGCIGVTTATVRHCSARILRKLGGRSLESAGEVLPSYFDSQYGCDMEILRFDSSAPGSKYDGQILRYAQTLFRLPVICATPAHRPRTAPAAHGLLPSLAALAERHVPCFGTGRLAPA